MIVPSGDAGLVGLAQTGQALEFLKDHYRQRCAERSTPARATVILTLTAPIRVPAKTVSALELEIDALLRAGVDARDRIADVWGNAARLRLVEPASTRSYKLIGFVHHRGIDAKHLLDLAERWLVEAT